MCFNVYADMYLSINNIVVFIYLIIYVNNVMLPIFRVNIKYRSDTSTVGLLVESQIEHLRRNLKI
jgi:hypothetical protein